MAEHGRTGPAAPMPWQYGPPPAPRDAYQAPARVDPIPGTPFGLVYLAVPPSTSGPAVGSLVTGIISILVSLVVSCFGLLGGRDGWGAWVAGAFAVLAGVFGLAGVGLGLAGARQVRRVHAAGAARISGRGLAITGLACGSVGLFLTVVGFVTALVIQLR